ncbi:MAG: alpha/beta hydrolase [Chryseolinea sp.]
MKKILVLMLLFACGCCLKIHGQDRRPIYLHGLKETHAEWDNWSTLFAAERRMTAGDNQDHPSQTGVLDFVNHVPFLTNNNSILFGHSMGGIVGRHMERTRTNPFSGIITAGSPLDGARIANSLTGGQIGSYVTNGIDKVLKGPIRQLGPAQGVLYQVASHYFKSLAEAYINTLIQEKMSSQSATDLAENSPYMNNGHRTATSTMPKIHIYGNENSPVLWRIVSINKGWTDGYLVGVTQQAYDVCVASKVVNINAAFANPILAPQYTYIADGWDTSAKWIKNDSENGWNDLIGASTPTSKQVTSSVTNWTAMNQCLSQYHPATTQQYAQCQQQNTQNVTTTVYSTVNGISDGFIKATSSTGFLSTWSENAAKIEALGVNHLEMKDHAAIKQIYNNIFDGAIPGINSVFLTVRR